MPARKRIYEEVPTEEDTVPVVSPTLQRLRNMWEFACLMQYIYFFGECIKISQEVDIDV